MHTAALHGAAKVVEFLCQGIDAAKSCAGNDDNNDQDPNDGGLANVDIKDSNGWTALHFAAGANSVEATRILVEYRAELNVEATNGYTPLQWAERMSNDEVADYLREQSAARLDEQRKSWMISSQPLSMIANRFFSMIPSP